jgi:hypothetical protein
MKLSERQIREAAYHEAGHAAVTILQGRRFVKVRAFKKGRPGKDGAILGLMMGGEIMARTQRAYVPKDIAEWTLIHMAGPAVSRKMGRSSWLNVLNCEGIGDFHNAMNLLDKATDRYWAYRYLKLVRARASEVIETHWELIAKIGDALIERETLTYAEVLKIAGRKKWSLDLSVNFFTLGGMGLFSPNKQRLPLPKANPWWLDRDKSFSRLYHLEPKQSETMQANHAGVT